MPRRTAKISRSNDTTEEDSNIEDSNIEIEPVEDDEEITGETMISLGNLKELIFLGRLREVVDIAGYKFAITTLSARNQKEIMQRVMKFDQLDRLLDVKPVTVSYVIESINGVSLKDLCDNEELESDNDKRLDVVLNMQSSVMERVYQIYEKLVIASNENIGLEDLKV